MILNLRHRQRVHAPGPLPRLGALEAEILHPLSMPRRESQTPKLTLSATSLFLDLPLYSPLA